MTYMEAYKEFERYDIYEPSPEAIELTSNLLKVKAEEESDSI